ncbi:phosducin-like [Salvelinus alpinus]|uniref:Phosducin n=1 Tax=Salvelinus namaycush TaxID=8040 RepID=A0A8U1BV92_SALNM|nr:phosducin [Salvelinus alpinus]XP_038859742.1 phosducin-like [Salvelinus namaycush]
MSSPTPAEDEVPAIQTGPKGVINDWRKFKCEDQDTPPSKKALLRQISNPQSDDIHDRLNRKMSVQEYEMIAEEDEKGLRKYRKQCMKEMHERFSFGPTFDSVVELDNGEAFLEVIEKEHRLTLVVVHIYKDGVKGCEALNSCLDCLATEYPSIKFCRIEAAATGAGERFSDDVLPAMLVYKAGELLGNFLSMTQHLSEEFFAADIEAFLNEYGLLPEKEFVACPDEEEAAGVEVE